MFSRHCFLKRKGGGGEQYWGLTDFCLCLEVYLSARPNSMEHNVLIVQSRMRGNSNYSNGRAILYRTMKPGDVPHISVRGEERGEWGEGGPERKEATHLVSREREIRLQSVSEVITRRSRTTKWSRNNSKPKWAPLPISVPSPACLPDNNDYNDNARQTEVTESDM